MLKSPRKNVALLAEVEPAPPDQWWDAHQTEPPRTARPYHSPSNHRARADATESGIWSGSTLFPLSLWPTVFCYCNDRALLPSIICLARLRIAIKYIFNFWQLRQGVYALVQLLEHWTFIWTDQVQIPKSAGNFFSYASFLCYDFHVVRWGLVWDRTLYAKNGFTSS